jgi:hypothetical protein
MKIDEGEFFLSSLIQKCKLETFLLENVQVWGAVFEFIGNTLLIRLDENDTSSFE